ncbi:MAG: hypothetical protein RSD04_04740 [Clostridia bacterium]
MIFLIIAECILIFFACGARAQGYFDASLGALCVDIIILNKIKLFKIKIFECKRKFYIQINKKNIARLTDIIQKMQAKKQSKMRKYNDSKKVARKKENSQNSKNKNKNKNDKENVFTILRELANELERAQIVIDRLNINFAYSSEDLMKTGLVFGASELMVGVANGLANKFFDPIEKNINLYTNAQTNNLKINFDILIKFGLAQIFFFALRILKKRRINE